MPTATREKTQTFENHRRINPLFHLVATPLVAFGAVYAVVRAVQHPSMDRWALALTAIGLWAAVIASRTMALTLQNRLIRDEMRLRLREVLPAALQPRIRELRVKQLAALRFAGDAELPALVERTLAGEFPHPREIKRAVRDWQADYLRV